jgi:hypothetical protein
VKSADAPRRKAFHGGETETINEHYGKRGESFNTRGHQEAPPPRRGFILERKNGPFLGHPWFPRDWELY